MLNFDSSYVHSTYFLKGKKVDHIKKMGDLVITSGKLCACDFCYLEDKSRNQEMDLIVPTGKYPVLLDIKEHLVNIMFNPIGDIFFWEDIKFKRDNYPDSIEVDEGEYGFIDKDGILAIEENTKNGVYPKGVKYDEPVSGRDFDYGYSSMEMGVENSKNNLLSINTLFGDDEYTFRAGYNDWNRINCISGCLLGKNFGIGLYFKSETISTEAIEHFTKLTERK